jgi:hypothetical protein
MSNKNIKWAAELCNVCDVSVRGLADLEFWTTYLGRYGLTPAERNGNAEIIIIGGAARFHGVAFRELSFAVILSTEQAANCQEAAFLLHSYNSCRFFAFCERVFFSTPYSHANVSLSHSLPASMMLEIAGKEVLRITMGSAELSVRQPTFCGREDWDGAVYLPYDLNRKAKASKLFFSRVQGDARKFSFDESRDTSSIQPSASTDVLAKLVESRFTPYEWITRECSTHAKSKTYSATKFACKIPAR